ncbi:MAG: amidohydrolase, partial [Deltaproteobacteria bacterium]
SYHCVSDGPWVERRIGRERAHTGAYAWRALLQSGATIAWGTDTPVEREDPIAGFYAFVTRRMADGRRFHPEQSIARLEALRAMTRDAAAAAGLEGIVGSIRPGMKADLVVLDADPLTVPEDRIPSLRVLMTIFDGRVVHDSTGRGS